MAGAYNIFSIESALMGQKISLVGEIIALSLGS